MKLLLVSATPQEIQPFVSHFKLENQVGKAGGNDVKVLITGVGMVATAFAMGRILAAENFDLAINAGIAGAFNRSLKLGETVLVSRDCFADLGAEDSDQFLSIDQLGFGNSVQIPLHSKQFGFLNRLKSVSAISVNKVHGNEISIERTVSRLNPEIETMEGAAFFYACNQSNLPCIQLRSISNYVERRNRESWNIPQAIKNLNNTLIELVSVYKSSF